MPEWHGLELGATLRYQSAVHGSDDSSGLPIRQSGYATLDLLPGICVADHLKAGVNVRNVADVQYLNSPEWGQGFDGAPRSAIGTSRFEYRRRHRTVRSARRPERLRAW